MKVHMQTQDNAAKKSMPRLAANIFKSDGLGGFYSGLTASVMRQMTYTSKLNFTKNVFNLIFYLVTRFGCYETAKQSLPAGSSNSFLAKVGLAAFGGACGGLIGTPADLVNVRMQADIKLPVEQRRHYKNAIDGVFRIANEEGSRTLFNGGTTAVLRAIFMTVGQLAFYDQVKQMLIQSKLMDDTVPTHLFSSIVAASAATFLTMPVDVMKTKMMNAQPGEFKGVGDCFVQTARSGGIPAFYRGFIPSFVRMTPHTVSLYKHLLQQPGQSDLNKITLEPLNMSNFYF